MPLENKKIKEHYDKAVRDRYQNSYEFNRWFKHLRTYEDFYMTRNAITRSVSNVKFSSCLEIGPGPGTWTTLLYRQNPEATFKLVDISEEMKNQFKLEMRELPNISYEVYDFSRHTTDKQYDFVCSFRTLEYFDDKELFIKKVDESMNQGGTGMFVTKNPNYRWAEKREKRKDDRFQHQGKITHQALKELLTKQGFRDIKIYPVVIRMPLIDRINTKLSRKFFERWYTNELTKKKEFFTESYLITFKKYAD